MTHSVLKTTAIASVFASVFALSACSAHAPYQTQKSATAPQTQPTEAKVVKKTIIVAHPVLHGLTQRLLRGTDIAIFAAAPARLPASRQGAYLAGRGLDALLAAAPEAQAVIGMRSVWSDDQLYPLARRANIRLVEVDAANPVEGDVPGITFATSSTPSSDKRRSVLITQPWQEAANLARMASIVADGLSRLYPETRLMLQTNARAMAAELQAAQAAASAQLAQAEDLSVLLLSERVQTLASALQLDVVDWQPPAKDAELPAAMAVAIQRYKPSAVLAHTTPDSSVVEQLKAANIPLIILAENAPDPVAALSKAFEDIGAAFK